MEKEEIFEDEDGKKKRIYHQNKLITEILLEPSKLYKEKMELLKISAKKEKEIMRRNKEIAQKMREIAINKLKLEGKTNGLAK